MKELSQLSSKVIVSKKEGLISIEFKLNISILIKENKNLSKINIII